MPPMAPTQRVFLAIAGFILGLTVASFIGAAVVAAGGWEFGVPATIGSELGRAVRQVGRGVPLDDHRIPAGVQALLNLPLWAGLIGAPLMLAAGVSTGAVTWAGRSIASTSGSVWHWVCSPSSP